MKSIHWLFLGLCLSIIMNISAFHLINETDSRITRLGELAGALEEQHHSLGDDYARFFRKLETQIEVLEIKLEQSDKKNEEFKSDVVEYLKKVNAALKETRRRK